MDGILMGLIFSNFTMALSAEDIGWDKMSTMLGYVFVGFIGGLFIGVITAFTLNRSQLKAIFNVSVAFIVLMLGGIFYYYISKPDF